MVEHSNQLKEILVPVDGSEASLDALALACSIAKRNKGKVYAVYVIEVARTLPLDADLTPEVQKGEEILAAAERRAQDAIAHARQQAIESIETVRQEMAGSLRARLEEAQSKAAADVKQRLDATEAEALELERRARERSADAMEMVVRWVTGSNS